MCVKINWGLGGFFGFCFIYFSGLAVVWSLLFLLRPFKMVKDCLDASLPSLRLSSVPNVW